MNALLTSPLSRIENKRNTFACVSGLMLALMLSAGALSAQEVTSEIHEAPQREMVKLWPKGLPEGAMVFSKEKIAELKKKETKQRLTYVQEPTLEVFLPPSDKANGAAVVVCPGGGYNILAIEHEGIDIAQWFNSIGVTAFVLRYRIPRRTETIHKEPMQDVQRAIRLVRHQSEKWKIDPERIGVLGFSAGGHLTLMSGLQYDTTCYEPVDDADQVSARPDFICPIYAAFMGPNYEDRKTTELSELIKVTESTPPTFMAVTLDDAMRGAQAAAFLVRLKENKIPAELHVYVNGGHGYGIRKTGNPVSKWNQQLADWLDVMKLTSKK
ncbi:MAG: alpha/beta hydrolase [Planctomycetota bacterium]